MQQLEEEVGVDLFEPSGRGIRLTLAGRMFLERAKAILSTVDAAVGEAREATDGRIGTVAIGFGPGAAYAGLDVRGGEVGEVSRRRRGDRWPGAFQLGSAVWRPLSDLGVELRDVAMWRADAVRSPLLRPLLDIVGEVRTQLRRLRPPRNGRERAR